MAGGHDSAHDKVQPGFLAAQADGDAFQAYYIRKHKEGNCQITLTEIIVLLTLLIIQRQGQYQGMRKIEKPEIVSATLLVF